MKLWTWLTRRHQKEADLVEELQFHLDEEIATGASSAAARRELGNLGRIQEETRAAWTVMFLERLAQDLRYAFRNMRANKLFSALAILSLALGIGANTAIFSFMDAILLRSLPVGDPQSLVNLAWRTKDNENHGFNSHNSAFRDPAGGFVGGVFSYPAYAMFRGESQVFQAVFGYQGAGSLNVVVGNLAALAKGEYITGNYFSALGVAPAAGRLISPDDDRPDGPAVAVVTYAYSHRRFAGPVEAVGSAVLINNLPYRIIGVTPPEFFGADPEVLPEVFVPMRRIVDLQESNRYHEVAKLFGKADEDWVVVMARLRPAVTLQQAQAILAPQFTRFEQTSDVKYDPAGLPALFLRDGRDGLDGLQRRYSKPLAILLTLVGLILLIACSNIANLLLARASSRRREMAVRLSIGAGRARIVRQLLTESLLLSGAGGVLAIAVASAGIRFLTALLANGRENFTLHAELNWLVLAAVAGLSLLTGVLFGLAPALQATRVDLFSSLKESRAGATNAKAGIFTLSRGLMSAQIALVLVILVAAGLFVRTLSNLESIDVGFNRENVLTFRLDARAAGHKDPEILSLYANLRERFASIPGVRDAGLSEIPLIGAGDSMSGVSMGGAKEKTSLILQVGSGFLETMQIPLLMGRSIEDADLGSATLPAVVNQAFVKQFLKDRQPIGEVINIPYELGKRPIQIVGLARDARYGKLRNAADPTVYLPFSANLWGPVKDMYYELRTVGDPLARVSEVRDIVRQADPRIPVANIRTQSDLIDSTISQEIVFARLCSTFAILALIIACVGLYGSMSYAVARRTSEIGIRMALGARRDSVVWMVLKEALLIAGAGLAVSLPTAYFASKLIESYLFDMKGNDPVALTGAVVVLVAASLAAAWIPARAASRIDPMAALRHE